MLDDNCVNSSVNQSTVNKNTSSKEFNFAQKSDKQLYAQALTKNISDSIKTPGAEMLKQQWQHDHDRASVMIYGMSGQEDNDVARTK